MKHVKNRQAVFVCCLAFIMSLMIFAVSVPCAPAQGAEKIPEAMRKWQRESNYTDNDDMQSVSLKATYYANEYIEALVNAEAEKNLWTADELENYKYTLLKTLNLHDSIAFKIDFNVTGMPIYAQPFDRHITLLIGKKKYRPTDYDRRFNFKISGQRDGMVYFPRYDPQTGVDLLKGVKELRMIFDASISHAMARRGDILWVWDITKDRPEALKSSRATDRLEVDRLLKRLDKLNSDKNDLQTKLDAVNKELREVNSRVNELQSR